MTRARRVRPQVIRQQRGGNAANSSVVLAQMLHALPQLSKYPTPVAQLQSNPTTEVTLLWGGIAGQRGCFAVTSLLHHCHTPAAHHCHLAARAVDGCGRGPGAARGGLRPYSDAGGAGAHGVGRACCRCGRLSTQGASCLPNNLQWPRVGALRVPPRCVPTSHPLLLCNLDVTAE